MGTVFSSNKDFNRTLATQPRAPVGLLKFDIPDNLQQHPLTKTLSIPVPFRYTQSNIRTSINQKQPLRSESNQPLTQQDTVSLIEKPTVENQTSPEKQLLARSASYTIQPTTYEHNSLTMNKDARIVYRSVVNLNPHRRINNRQLSSFEPQRSIVERNGKQFVTELKERMERRHVQVFDETTGRMRLFEVLDYIPSRVVRSAKNNPQLQPQNSNTEYSNSNSSSSSSESHLERGRQSNHQSQANEFELYQRGVLLPTNNNNTMTTTRIIPGQGLINDRHQSNEYDKAYVSSRGGSTQHVPASYQPSSVRHRSPSGSEYSASTSTSSSTASEDGSDDGESYDPVYSSNNRTESSVFYGTRGGSYLPTEIDPFQKSVNPHNSYYIKRQDSHRYAQPVSKQMGYPRNPHIDYSLLIH